MQQEQQMEDSLRPHVNGKFVVTPMDARLSWRMQAMETALHCEAEDGTPFYILLSELQKHICESTARHFVESKKRVYGALSRVFSELLPILCPAWNTDKGKAADRIFGWWQGITPNGTRYEIILVPHLHSTGTWIIAGVDIEELNRLCDDIIADATRHTCHSLQFSSGVWEDAPDLDEQIATVTYDDIILAPDLLTDIRSNINTFFAQKTMFQRLGFPWRRGILLVGPPGTGKTMLCKAVANAHPEVRFLYVRDVNAPRHLNVIFEKARSMAPCILAIEDMDGLINKDNRTIFLNELDGFTNNNGLLIIASSNHPERIDEALLKRPSRFDRVYHIGLPEAAERMQYCRQLLEKSSFAVAEQMNVIDMAAEIAKATEGFTPAFLKEAVLSAMLDAAQNGKEALDADFVHCVQEQVGILKNYLKKARNPEAFAEMSTNDIGMGFRNR